MEQSYNYCDFSDLFNQIVVYPLKTINPEFEQKAMMFQRNLEAQYFSILEENRLKSRFSLMYPAFECVKQNIEEEHIKNMLNNFILKSLDNKTYSAVHPRFVKIIEQMSWQDVMLFQHLNQKRTDILICKPILSFDANRKVISYALPQYITNIDLQDVSAEEISIAINNLANIGLIELSFVEWGAKERYADLLKNEELQTILSDYKTKYPHLKDLTIRTGVFGVVKITDFGILFGKICLQ